jgi:hypothetical protein
MKRKYILGVTAGLLVLIAVFAISANGRSSVTRARLERDLPATFSNLYVQQAQLLGHPGITVKSLHARAMCDKHGPGARDHGASADWVCLMSWKDPNVPLPDGYGKFELNVHSNGCYTAGGPSKLLGLITLTDAHGKDVPNPVFEFDSCLDPHGSNAPTGVTFPSAVAFPSELLPPNAQGQIAPLLTCSIGRGRCEGEISATAGGQRIGSASYAMKESHSQTVTFTLPPNKRAAGTPIVLTAHPKVGTASNSPAELAVPKS